MAEINSLEEHEALQYEIHRRGYNKYGVRSDAYLVWFGYCGQSGWFGQSNVQVLVG